MPKPRGGRGGHAKTSSSSSSRAGPGGGRKTGSGSGPRDHEAASRAAQAHQQRTLSPAQQQRLLDVFARALGPALASPQLPAVLQAVKSALFARDFAAAFDAESSSSSLSSDAPPPLDAYAARWSPTRALCYAAVLDSPLLREHWQQSARRMVAIGGGAAEAVAFGALFTEAEVSGDLVLVDQAPWNIVVQRLYAAMTGQDLVAPSRFTVDVRQLDILQVDDKDMQLLLTGSPLITLFFTLNELFTAGGIGAAATFLLRLTAAAAPGTLLLVVDSPGSYAETTVGTQARRYPMRWLLDKILLEDAPVVDDDSKNPAWTRLHQDDAIWFRLPSGLAYPIRLEDMRYQIHLYKREGGTDEEKR